jgi:hypothetical protein
MVVAHVEFDATTQKERFDEPDVALDWSQGVLPVPKCCIAKAGMGEEDIPKGILQASVRGGYPGLCPHVNPNISASPLRHVALRRA